MSYKCDYQDQYQTDFIRITRIPQLMENVRPTVDRFEISDRSVILYVSEVRYPYLKFGY